MDAIVLLVILLLGLGFVLVLFGITFFGVLDDISIYFLNRPVYVHLYIRTRKIEHHQERILLDKFRFYQRLTEKQKRYFQHRISRFIEKYEFIPRDDFQIDDEVKTLVAATYVMLTFGMRRYLVDAFDKIIIYPEPYLSTLSQEYHKGEFNPRMKAVAFSWPDFLAGYEINNDNLNLGIHEFSHVVHINSLRYNDASSLNFKKHHDQLIKEINHPRNHQQLIDSEYFRLYAYTNHYEFISVIIEHYFETPSEFQSKFPMLYQNVSRMLNHQHTSTRR